jgi:DNA-directed RNA polymerase subunit M/transcription elongation factor TFIIS
VATTQINDPEIQRVIEDANRGVDAEPEMSIPSVEEPPDPVFRLAAGYVQDDGQWTTEFEVRELTGRDEEALARIKDVGRTLVAMVQRGVLRLGSDVATEERLDSLIGGDWDTLLVAIRASTFGRTVDLNPTCRSCGVKYEVTVDLLKDLSIRTANPEDLEWTVTTPRHTYEVSLYTGATQRRIFESMSEDRTVATINTDVLYDSVSRIDGMPVLGIDAIRDLSMSDRRAILASIQERRVGPDLQGVTIKCPTCGHEQASPLNAAALFQ